MMKLGWLSFAGAVAIIGTPVAYAALSLSAARSTPSLMILSVAGVPPRPALAALDPEHLPSGPALSAAEFSPFANVPVDQAASAPSAAAKPRPVAAKALPRPVPVVASDAERPTPDQSARRERVALTEPAAPKPAAAPAPKAPAPLLRSAAPAARPEAKPEKDAGAAMLSQVAKMKRTLRLTPDQEPQWAPVEAMLRDIARQQAQRKAAGTRTVGGFALTEDEMSRLSWTAAPLIFNLREDQKQEARQLARAMGLEQVASAF